MFLELDPELEIVGEANDGAEALQLARQLGPDVVIMDLLMPVMDGIEATAAIRHELPDTEVIALTSVLEDASVVGAVRAGAIGYLLKDTQPDALCQAIKAAAACSYSTRPRSRQGCRATELCPLPGRDSSDGDASIDLRAAPRIVRK